MLCTITLGFVVVFFFLLFPAVSATADPLCLPGVCVCVDYHVPPWIQMESDFLSSALFSI